MPQTLSYLRPLFHEMQHLRANRAGAFLFGLFGIAFVAIATTTRILDANSVRIVVGILGTAWIVVLALLFGSSMTTVIDAAGVHVRYFPYLNRTFDLDDIVAWTARTYDPMEYGGWGVRGFPGRYGWAYNVRGNRGVEIEFRNGHRLMLGSQRADELAKAIDEAKRETG